MPDYVPKDTDTLCLFRITPQDGVDPVKKPLPPWPVNQHRHLDGGVDRPPDRLRQLPRQGLQGQPVPGNPGQYFAWVAYDIILFEEGSIANITASLIGNVFSFKPLKAARLEDIRIAGGAGQDLQGPADRTGGRARAARTSSAARCWAPPPSPSWACRAATTAA
jgi:ribulose-bisphosphate carboxylase large chain